MIEITHGDLLRAEVEALVNTVNCEGAMGKGIALQFKKTFPANTRVYAAACRDNTLEPGRVLIVEVEPELDRQFPRYIINFTTKDNWRRPSKIEWIRSGLTELIQEVKARQIRSIALPPLGCGNGGLNWGEVYALIASAFSELPDVRVLVYPPEGAPSPDMMRHNEPAPKMSEADALYISLIESYRTVERAFSELELQKLAYFLQELGQPLKLHFTAGRYGPYAPEIRHVIGRWEGHWMTGYGDGTGGARKTMTLEPKASIEGKKYLNNFDPVTIGHLNKVANLVEGFDTPFGLELLATVHWVARYKETGALHDPQQAVEGVYAWSDYKRNTFSPEYIELAWDHLKEQGWLDGNTNGDVSAQWEEDFRLQTPDLIRDFVTGRPHLVPLLAEGAMHLHESFPLCPLNLRVVNDPNVPSRHELVLAVQTRMDAVEASGRMETFADKWWSHNIYRSEDDLTITLDFVI